ncbi:MAG: tetratricopeptide repeat protein [Blautia sp.]|nr:tetratricopeptide repeat protein [Blautia sp.]
MRAECDNRRTKFMRVNALLFAALLALAACGKADDTEIDAYRQYGINCLEGGKYPEAVEAFQSALNQSKGRVGEKELDICFYKARAQYLGGDADAAMETYNAVIEYNGDARAYYLRGSLYFDLGDSAKALADYKTAIEEAQNNYELYIGIYGKMSENGLAADGQQYLNQAMEIKGEKAEDCLYKGRISYLLEDYGSAVTYLKKALEGEEPLAAYYLGQTYEAMGDSASARIYIQQYLDSGTATSYDLYELGTQEQANGNYAQALVYFNAGLQMEEVPNKQNLMKSAIAAYEYSGDFASAKKLLADYVKQYPSDEAAQKESTFLETR